GGRSIGVLLDSPVDRAVAQLAILRRRATYVPLDVAARPVVPELAAVVTTQDRVESVSGEVRTVLLDRLDSGAVEIETGASDGDGLAYLIPGSDDDGPDVLLSYPAVLGRAAAVAAALGIGPDDRVLWGAPGVPCDGAFPYGLLVSLITGATLVCPPWTDFDDPKLWLDTVKESGATVWFSNTYAFETVTDLAARRSDRPLASLRLVALRGTPPWSALIDRMRSANDDCIVEFVDGFAETGSYSFISDPDRPAAGDRSTVATLNGQSAYLLDEDLQPCAVGVGGLIAVGGEGVAMGYFGSAALTAERFVPDPYSERPGGRLFISTAAGWRRSDGRLEYVGSFNCAVERSDALRAKQIDRQLFANLAVRQAITTAGPGEHGSVMTSYVVSDAPVEDLKADLAGRIPAHLLPIVVRRPRLPLTTGGQVDVAALHPAGTPAPYVEPTGELEVRIARLCAELLGCERVSMTDNFFDLGGHSLLLARLAGLIDEELGVTVSLQELFEAADLRAMADVVGNCET
ncbi:MAG TPA: AMP-binding protein, partial [Mycobacteriales bacterium]|nr:AMP-binding protein [Mycobacteriales bacterium]